MTTTYEKVTLVTGAGGPIGRAIALKLASEGHAVGCLDLRRKAVDETAQIIEDAGGAGTALPADITQRAELAAAFKTLAERYGTPTGLVNNAGVISLGPFESISDAEWQKTMRVNLKAPLIAAIEFAKSGLETDIPRAIVNIGSVAAVRVMMNRAHYCASKAGIVTVTKGLALELARYHIRVNCIHPKGIESGMSGNWISAKDSSTQVSSGGWLDDPAQRAVVYQSLPIGRHGQPNDVAHASAFLLSERSSWVTGACLAVDGGYLAGDMFTV